MPVSHRYAAPHRVSSFLASQLNTPQGAGAMIAAVETVCGKRATVVGKPAATMLQHLLSEHALDPSRTVMVGDRLDTDIAFGSAGGVKTCLVLTGVATQTEAEALPAGHPCRPDHLMASLADISF